MSVSVPLRCLSPTYYTYTNAELDHFPSERPDTARPLQCLRAAIVLTVAGLTVIIGLPAAAALRLSHANPLPLANPPASVSRLKQTNPPQWLRTAALSAALTGATVDSAGQHGAMAADLQGAPLLQEVQENLAMKGIANREASSVSLPQGWTLPKELTLPRAVPDTLHTVQLSAVQWAGLLSVVAGVIGIATARAKTSGQSPRAAGADLERFIPGINSPGERYDPETSRQYFMSRPGVVLRRFLEMAYLTNGWIIGLLYDKYFGKVEENEPIRAEAARQLAIKLGPTFIKLGQALSIRPDLIPKAYSEELRLLQDAVPPFDSNQARAIISMELGITESQMSSIFVQMSSEPVASASIGQVYKAKLQDGRDVAVKVQRPRVPEIIALDLFLVRTLAPIYKKITKTETDLVALVDEWGKGFVDELDYRREAENTTQFRNAMAERGLDAVTAPEVLPELSASRILTTSWVDGCRLDVSKESDVPRLCGVALNAYLSMLLDTGTLHCDPHPGNLLRMSDGRLCILDWGMTTSVQNDIQYSLIEYIAHIISEDYDKLPRDFVNLGFLVPEKEEEIRRSGTLAPLTYMLRQLSAGGGPKRVQQRIFEEYRAKYPGKTDDELRVEMRAEMKASIEEERKKQGVDVGSITYKVEELQAQNRAAFRIPPYFLYISRAFATLEGIGLQMDEDYAILQECYPYLARRLLSDSSPRAEAALRSLLYGTGESLKSNSLTRIASGFTDYSKSTASAAGGTDEDVLWQGAELLLNPEGNVIQQVLVDEAAAAASGRVKEVLATSLEPAKRLGEALGPLQPLAAPLLMPAQLLTPFTKKTETEEQSLALVNALLESQAAGAGAPSEVGVDTGAESTLAPQSVGALVSQVPSSLSNVDVETVGETVNRLWDLQPGITAVGGRFANSLLKQASENVERVLGEEEVPEFANGIMQGVLGGIQTTQESLANSLPAGKEVGSPVSK